MHELRRASSDMTHEVPVRCVARRMKWPDGEAGSLDGAAAAAARSKHMGESIYQFDHCDPGRS